MPCFCLISGHLSPAEIDERRARGLCQLFATFTIFQTLYYLNLMISYRLNGFKFDALPVPLFNPPGQVVTWFLLALLIWRVAMPSLNRTRAPVCISLVFGLTGALLDLGVNHQNIFSFFPYYVVGNRMPRSLWSQHLGRLTVRVPLALGFVLALISLLTYSALGGAHFAQSFDRLGLTYSCFNGAPPDSEKGACSTLPELVKRFVFYLVSAPLILGFLSLMPTRRGIWTVPGYMSMYVYLLHPLILFNPLVMHFTFQLLSHLYGREVNVWSPATNGSVCLFIIPAVLLICVLLSLPATRCVFSPLVEPPIDRLFQKDVFSAARGGSGSAA